MEKKKILWLASWYPNKKDLFNGDFIQRHANAAASYNDIHVIHIEPDEEKMITGNVKEEVSKKEGLTEQIIYFKKSLSFTGKIKGFFKWFKLYKTAIKKYVEHNGKPSLVHVHVPMKAGLLALWAKKKYGFPFVVTEHWGIYNEDAEGAFFKQKKWFRYLTRYIISRSANLMVESRDLGDSMNRLVAKKNFEIIPNVVDTSSFYFENRAQNKKFRYIHVSTMNPFEKRPGDLLEAFLTLQKEDENIELYMVGPWSQDVYKHATATGQIDKSIFFTGEIKYTDVAIQLKMANAFVLCSQYENQPCVILEALCCGLPVIATGVGGIPELIDTTNGLLVKPQNIKDLSEAMKTVKENYFRYDRQRIADEAQSKFNYRAVGKMLDDVYQRF